MAEIDIIRVIAPSSAAAGAPIPIQVNVRNNGTQTYDIAISGYVNGIAGTDFYMYLYPLTAPPGSEPGMSIPSAFIMPNVAVGITVHIISWYRPVGTLEWTSSGDTWITIEITTQQYLGQITAMKLRVYSTDRTIPVGETMPLGVSARLRITGRNDMSSYQRLGISWTISSGSWSVTGTNWGWQIPPGGIIEIDSSDFTLEVGGSYILLINLLSEDGHVLDTYSGAMCTVASAGPPAAWTQLSERSGSIRTKAVTPPAWIQVSERSGSINKGVTTPTGWTQLGQSVSATIKPGLLIPSDFKLVQENVYPDGKTYSGPAQRCFASWRFLPPSFPVANWFTEHLFINHLADKVTEQGEKILTMKLYEKGIDYILVIETTNTATGYVRAFPWAIVIVGALVLAIIIVLTVLILKTEDFFYKAPAAALGFIVLILGVAAAGVVGLALYKGAIGGKKKTPARVPVK